MGRNTDEEERRAPINSGAEPSLGQRAQTIAEKITFDIHQEILCKGFFMVQLEISNLTKEQYFCYSAIL